MRKIVVQVPKWHLYGLVIMQITYFFLQRSHARVTCALSGTSYSWNLVIWLKRSPFTVYIPKISKVNCKWFCHISLMFVSHPCFCLSSRFLSSRTRWGISSGWPELVSAAVFLILLALWNYTSLSFHSSKSDPIRCSAHQAIHFPSFTLFAFSFLFMHTVVVVLLLFLQTLCYLIPSSRFSSFSRWVQWLLVVVTIDMNT